MSKRFLVPLFVMFTAVASPAQNNWEVGAHYSWWGMGYFILDEENDAAYAFDAYGGPLNFDTHGTNFGFSLRYFPGGKQGSFSLGFSYERNYFEADLSGFTTETAGDAIVTKTGSGSVDLSPHSFNVDVRWELFPGSRLHPYVGLGFGVGPQKGDIVFTTVTETDRGGVVTSETVKEELTLKEAITKIEREREKEDPDEDFYMVDFFPILYLTFGLRAELSENVFLLGELAFYDGFIARGGLAFRF